MLSTRQVVNVLKEQGHKVEYKLRSDGGIFISKIDGKSYSRAEGNKVARVLANAPLSERRTRQLEYATRQQRAHTKVGYTPKAQKIKTPRARGKRRLDSELTQEELLKRQLQRTQKAWRKTQKGGIITAKKVRYIVEQGETLEKGYDTAIGKLKRLEQYAKGYAFSENVEGLIGMFSQLLITAEGENKEAIEIIIELIESKKDVFKEQWLKDLLMFGYNFRNGEISAQQLVILARFIIK